jgi:hypothetical protein
MPVRIPSAFFLAVLALAVLCGACDDAFAAPGECRFIQSRKERNACYAREEAAKAAAAKSNPARVNDQIDQMKIENDRLGKRLQGICRGC